MAAAAKWKRTTIQIIPEFKVDRPQARLPAREKGEPAYPTILELKASL